MSSPDLFGSRRCHQARIVESGDITTGCLISDTGNRDTIRFFTSVLRIRETGSRGLDDEGTQQ